MQFSIIENSRWLNSAVVFLSFGEKVPVQNSVFVDLSSERTQDGLH